MPSFKTMDPDAVRELLKGHEDVLTSEVAKEQAFFRHAICPNPKCRGRSHEQLLDAVTPFSPQSPLPNKILKCKTCETEFNPYTGLVTRAPTGG